MMSIAVFHKKDGTGRVGVSISKISSIEEHLGANTATQFTIVQVGPQSFTVSEDFPEVLKAMNFAKVDEGPPAGG